MNIIFSILFLGLLISNCTSHKSPATIITNKNQQKEISYLSLKQGETKFLQKEQMNITFIKVKQSPYNKAKIVVLEVMGTHTRPMLLQLTNNHIPEKKYSYKTNFNGWTISLIQIKENEIHLNIEKQSTN